MLIYQRVISDKISWQFQTSSNLKGDVSRFQATFGWRFHLIAYTIPWSFHEASRSGRKSGRYPLVSSFFGDIPEVNVRNRLRTEVPTRYKAYFSGLNFREYPSKIWPYMVQYLHFRILEFRLTCGLSYDWLFSRVPGFLYVLSLQARIWTKSWWCFWVKSLDCAPISQLGISPSFGFKRVQTILRSYLFIFTPCRFSSEMYLIIRITTKHYFILITIDGTGIQNKISFGFAWYLKHILLPLHPRTNPKPWYKKWNHGCFLVTYSKSGTI